MALTTGYLIADRYRLSRRIAVGGMGEVWEADDTRLDRRVAVKVLKPELSGDAEFRHRFHTEARTTASLNHPGIAAVHDYGEVSTLDGTDDAEPDTSYLVMELVAGEPLAAILHRHPRLAADRTLDILGQCAEALQAAHARGLVHRDIKPGNILITPEGLVKLTDFGIAKAADAAPVTRQGMVMGTAHYIAPEQATGEEASSAGDVYSLGVVGYECLAGGRPFRSDNAVTVAMMHIRDVPPPLPPDVPPAVRELIETTLVKDPRQRYATGKEFALAVAAVRAGRRPPRPAGFGHPVVLAAGPPPRPILVPPGPTGPGPVGLGPVGLGHPPTGPYPHPGFAPRRTGRVVAAVVAGLLAVGLVVILVWVVSEAMRDGGAASMAPGAALPEQTDGGAAPTVPESTSFDDYRGLTGTDAVEVAVEQGWEPVVVDENGDDVSTDDLDSCRVIDVRSPRTESLLLTCVGGGS